MRDHAAWAAEAPDDYEWAFNPRISAPDVEHWANLRAAENDAALRDRRSLADIPYGDHSRHRLDLYRAEGPGPHPVHLFFHGGYWRLGHKDLFAFIGGGLAAHGITTFIANYELCPASDLDAVVASARAAFAFVAREAGRHGGDPARLTISGHSAGAHLCAAILASEDGAALPPGAALTGATLLSGAFNPTPAAHARVNAEIGLTPEIVRRHDMETLPPRTIPPTEIIIGSREPEPWIALSVRYAQHLRRAGGDPGLHVLAGHHHFSIMEEYRDPGSLTRRAIARQAGLA